MPKPARDAHLLEELARPLEPKRAPFYVAAHPSGRPDGWYWQLQPHPRPQYLGRNVYFAQRQILEELGRVKATAV